MKECDSSFFHKSTEWPRENMVVSGIMESVDPIKLTGFIFFSRPLSKTVKFNTLKVTKGSGNKKSFKKF
jgi:hypothetical protein